MARTRFQKNTQILTAAIDKALVSTQITSRQRTTLYKALFYLLMGEPIIDKALLEFAQTVKKEEALYRLARAIGFAFKVPQALHARIVESVSLRNVQRNWGITKSDIDFINWIVREANVDPYDEHHLLHRDYGASQFPWLAEVELHHHDVEVILNSQALEDMLLGVFETYKVPKSKKEPFSEVFGLCLGMASSKQVTKRGKGKRTTWFVYVEKAVPQIRAKSSQSSVTPSSRSIDALVETSNSLFPQLEIIGDYHSHPYRDHRQLKKYQGWHASREDAGSAAFLQRELRSRPERSHHMRVSFVIAIAKGRATSSTEGVKAQPHMVKLNMAGCHVYISAYRILSNGAMTSWGVKLQRPYRETYLRAA